jgi:hypothetical protein
LDTPLPPITAKVCLCEMTISRRRGAGGLGRLTMD